jgi:low temperature requirement protein LtrA
MAAMLVAAIALPSAFTNGVLVFGLALFVVRAIHAGIFYTMSHGSDPAVRRRAPLLTMSFLVQRHGSIIIIALGEVIVELGAGPPKACPIPARRGAW